MMASQASNAQPSMGFGQGNQIPSTQTSSSKIETIQLKKKQLECEKALIELEEMTLLDESKNSQISKMRNDIRSLF